MAEPRATTEGAKTGENPEIQRNAEGLPLASLDFSKPTPINRILSEFTDQTGIAVVAYGKAGETQATMSGENMTPEQFLTRLADQNKLVWRKTEEGYQLWDEATYKTEVLPTRVQQKIFIPVHIKADDFYDAIKRSNIITPDVGGAWVDKRSNQVVVVDLPEKLAMVQDLQNLIDVPQYTRIFHIKYADPEEIAKKIDDMGLKSEPGTIEVDPLNRTIIVRDVLANIQRMESLIEMLDVRQPERIYKLNSIGSDEDELSALNEQLKTLLTKDAYFYMDAKRGMLLVRDTPESHRDLERFLKYFNSPVPQVLIQAELFEVDQSVNLSYGTEVTWNENLVDAVKDNLVTNFATGSSADSPFGFIDFRKEFPLVSAGSGGLNLKYLDKHVKAELKAALSDNNSRLLLRPNITVKSRETASLIVGTQEPIATAMPLGYDTNQFSVSQSSVNAGLQIEFSPTVTPTGLVEIKLSISNSTAERIQLATGITSIPSIEGVKTNTDSADTVMIVPDGETEVISGLIRRTSADNVSGIPYLVKIPWIGPLLFGSKTDAKATRNLLFFVTPTVLYTEGKGNNIIHEDEGYEETVLPPSVKTITGETTGEVIPRERRFEAPTPGQIMGEEFATSTLPSAQRLAPDTEAGLRDLLGSESLPEALKQPEEVVKDSYKVRTLAPPVAAGGEEAPSSARKTPPRMTVPGGSIPATGPAMSTTATPAPTPQATPRFQRGMGYQPTPGTPATTGGGTRSNFYGSQRNR